MHFSISTQHEPQNRFDIPEPETEGGSYMHFQARAHCHSNFNTLSAQPLAPHPSLRVPERQRAPSTNRHWNAANQGERERLVFSTETTVTAVHTIVLHSLVLTDGDAATVFQQGSFSQRRISIEIFFKQ